MNAKILKYLKKTWVQYKSDIGLEEPYTYLYGNPVKVHVPIDVATGGLLIVGAYPTAHFNTVKAPDGKLIRDVPVADHLYPFSNEVYFDGSGLNTVKSGAEIEDYFLSRLGLDRSQCWITDLVKVFLFKQGHIDKYEQLGNTDFKANRNLFHTYAKKSLVHLQEEFKLAQPKAVLCLGAEVNAVVHDVSEYKATKMISSTPVRREINGRKIPLFACPHPGILMRGGEHGAKWRAVLNETLIEVKKYL